MPPLELVQQYVIAAWRLMMGKSEALRQLDLSVDGFWSSFYAMLVALPPLLLMWIVLANGHLERGAIEGTRGSFILRYALLEFAVWVLPLIAFALVARAAGLADRFVTYVIATNWASVIIAWSRLPITLLSMLSPDSELQIVLMFAVFIATSVLVWKLTNAVIAKGPGTASAVFVAMLIASLMTVSLGQTALGLGDAASAG